MEATINLYHSPSRLDGIGAADLKHAAAVVIDVLRVSNSIITAIDNGCRRVIPVAEVYEAKAIAVRLSSEKPLLCGEREARLIPGFDLGNSPAEYQRDRAHNRTLIFCSTNGTRALVCAAAAKLAVVGSFANLSAVVEKLKTESKVAIVCGGLRDRLSLEDTVCAGAFVDALMRARPEGWKLSDAAAAAQGLFLHHANNLLAMARSSEHGSYLAEIGFEEDIKFCTRVDGTKTVPVIRVDDLQLVTVSSS